MIEEKVIPIMFDKCPATSPCNMKVQQDNARAHVQVDESDAALANFISRSAVELVAQTANFLILTIAISKFCVN